MGSSNRQPYLTATSLTQAVLDECASNLENRLELAADIQLPDGTTAHVSDRSKYIVDSLTGQGTFYQARTNFPVISRTLGDWLSNTVEFSTLTVEVSNVDGAYNAYLPSGGAYNGFVGNVITVRLGLAELGTSYHPIFSGKITDVGGVSRSLKSVTFTARDLFDVANIQFPPNVYQLSAFPFIDDSLVNTVVPVIYGDWTYATDPSPASIPATAVNSFDLRVNKSRMLTVTIQTGSPAVFSSGVNNHLVDGVAVRLTTTGTLPLPFQPDITYYTVNTSVFSFNLEASVGSGAISSSGTQTGTHQLVGEPVISQANKAANLQCLISDNSLALLDQTQVYLKRGDYYYAVPQQQIQNVPSSNRYFEVSQDYDAATAYANWVPTSTDVNPTYGPYSFADGDLFFCRVKGKDLGSYSDNLVWQARDIILSYSSLSASQIDNNWATLRDKASPAQSAIATFKSRVWVQDQTAVLEYVKSMVEQVRLELFISKDQTVKLNSLHFEDWQATPAYTVKQWDIAKDTLTPAIDVRNNFNRAQANYNYLPDIDKEGRLTPFFKNTASIAQFGPKPVSKIVVYPNLFEDQVVRYQLLETLRLASATFEVISLTLTWRAMLLDVGDFVLLAVKVGGTLYDNVPCMIRSIGYDPAGLKLPITVWSFQMVPFPGYEPGFAGTVGGYQATITQE